MYDNLNYFLMTALQTQLIDVFFEKILLICKSIKKGVIKVLL